MKKDTYIQRELWKYGIKMCPLVAQSFDEDCFEFLHGVVKEDDLKKIIKFVRRELTVYSKSKRLFEASKVTSKLGKGKIKASRPTRKSEEADLIEDIHSDLKNALVKTKDWNSGLEKLAVSYKGIYKKALDLVQEYLSGYLDKNYAFSLYEEKLNSVKSIFKLSSKECKILTFFYLLDTDSEVDSLFRHGKKMDDMIKSFRMYCRFFSISPKQLKELMSKDSKLVKSGLITAKFSDNIEVSDLVKSYLAGYSRLDLMDNYLSKPDLSDAIHLVEHNIQQDKMRDVSNLLESTRGANILLHGKPGTGKTEFAKSLGKSLKKDLYFIKQANEDGNEDLSHRKSGIVAALNMLDKENSIIVIDECDEIINIYDAFWGCEKEGGKDNKAWINDLLEYSKHKIIWISNRTQGVHESTKRRFSYSMEFKELGKTQRLKVWENQTYVTGADFLNKEELQNLSRIYKVNAGVIALALKDVVSMTNLKEKNDKVNTLKNILAQQQSFIFGDNKLNPIAQTYSLDVLNCDVSLQSVLEASKKFVEYSEKVREAEITNMNFLFQGPPGTGKTEFVKYMAEVVDKELMVKRMSDLQSKYVGETEKMIAAAFREAEESRAILFLDEADSLFINRENAVSSWEVSQTNELLCQMENFKGMLVCATNFGLHMDGAVMRRFNYKIKFDFLNCDAKESLFLKMFSDKLTVPISNEQLNRVRQIPNLTPGDFKVVKQKNFFAESTSPKMLIDQLELESSYKKLSKPISLR